MDVQAQLQTIEAWSIKNKIDLSVKKCAVISTQPNLAPLYIYGQEIPQREEYIYLGFPVTPKGIDFPNHVQRRMEAAVGRCKWLSHYSDRWGPANRLRIYKQYLAPMFEYGGPLVSAWMKEHKDHSKAINASWAGKNKQQERPVQNNQELATAKPNQQSQAGYGALMEWISGTKGRVHVTANLCGLSSIKARFKRLKTGYQLIIDQMDSNSPLKQLLQQGPERSQNQFAYYLGHDKSCDKFKQTSGFEPGVKTALQYFLRDQHRETLQKESQRKHLTSLIPFQSRKVQGLR